MSISEPSGGNPNAPYSHDLDAPESDILATGRLPPDPLLKSGSLIDVNREKEQTLNEAQNGYVEHREANRAEPRQSDDDGPALRTRPVSDISGFAETTTEHQPSRSPNSVPEAPAAVFPERPNWLPEGWRMDCRVRTSGASAGAIDRYYVEPVKGHRFRSKKEVLHFLETGSTRKRKQNPDADVLSPENPGAHKQKKSGSKLKKSAPFDPSKFDFDKVPEEVSWVLTDASQGIWTPFLGDKKVSESNKQEWAAAFDYLNTKKTH
ncbi:hypothetical protein F0562_022313 [Nyssa sinensis]|uniref:MBD domain-containing protein n=1 Tax=Nyssa sinensis TaxID=561372 RepID=A0A5J5BSU0_9ASTE|nr:hypothetical protein F0562_022313 [Nyssa sinensis]